MSIVTDGFGFPPVNREVFRNGHTDSRSWDGTLQRQRAFNAGSDARIAGLPQRSNPHPGRDALPVGALWLHWDMGWRDVDEHWGVSSKWPILRLPDVVEHPLFP